MTITAGWHQDARRVQSPNCDARPQVPLELIVIHGISVPAGQFGGTGIVELFTNTTSIPALAQLRVAAHFVIYRTGELVQFVSCDRRAWHAGESCWRGREACNDFSIGIELEGTDELSYTDVQYTRLTKLIEELCATYPSITAIVGHSDIAPQRKTDPGPAFAWHRLFDLVGRKYDGRGNP